MASSLPIFMAKERRLPDNSVDVKSYLTDKGRDEIPLGVNHDGTTTTLTSYVDVDGVQVHPDRLEEYLKRLEKKGGVNS